MICQAHRKLARAETFVGRRVSMKNLTPQQIVRELDRYIVGQNAAKRVVAIAMRNRYRRSSCPRICNPKSRPRIS